MSKNFRVALSSILMLTLVSMSFSFPKSAHATTWYSVVDDTFSRSDTSAGSAGSTTGVGNDWIDVVGNAWNIGSGKLQGYSNTSSDYLSKFLIRPSGENMQDQREVVTIPAGENFGQFIGVVLRYQSSTGNHYLAHISASGIYLYKIVGGSTTLISSNMLSISNADSYSVDFSAVGVNSTALSVIVTDLSTNTQVGTISVTDNAASLQTSGSMGLSTWYNSGTTTAHISRVQTYTTALALTGSSSFTGSSGVAMPITNLQISGDSSTTTPVKLFVSNGTLAMSTTTGLTFTGGTSGASLYFSGTVANINAALATLTYTRSGAGSDTLEASLVNSGEVFFPDNGHLYKFITTSSTWTAAQSAAIGETAYGVSGYLATITSQSENNFISQRLTADGWIGASDAATEGDWKWVTGPESGTSFWSGAGNGSTVNGQYANWNAGEPNDSSNNEDCAEYYSGSGMWNDLPCTGTTLSGYMVEFGALGAEPVVVAKNVSITTQNAPTISSVTPLDNATAVNPTSNLSITFSQTVTVGTGNIVIKKTSDNSTVESIDVAGARVTGSGTATITIDPASNLPDLTSVYINIPNTAFKNGSNVYYSGISDSTTWNFTTSDITPPTVPGIPAASATPTNNVNPTITWSASTDAASGVQRYFLKWSQATDCSGSFITTTTLTSYTVPAALAEGTWYFCANARDNAQNNSAYSSAGIVVIDTTAPAMGTPVASPSITTSAISWSTNEEASSKVEYSSTGDYSLSTTETDTSPRVTGHAVTLYGLLPCTTYYYRITSNDAATNSSASTGTFMTLGCNSGHPVPPPFVAPPMPPMPALPSATAQTASSSVGTTSSTAASYGSIQPGFRFKTDMRYKQTSKDIARLQEFLKAQGPDIYPEGKVTGYFGPSTLAAVHRFQTKFTKEILTSIGLAASTGFAGPSTRSQLNSMLEAAGY